MVKSFVLVVAVVWLVGCLESKPRNDDVATVTSAIGNEDQNDFRNRKTEQKGFSQRKADCSNDPRVVLGLVPANVCVGADLFFRDAFGGNGRACGSCHTAQFDFTISPEFIASLEPDDPLFVAENNPVLAELERPQLMRDFGLILENVDGADAPTTKFVMRSVPHAFSLTTSITPPPIVDPMTGITLDGTTNPPIQRTGWGGDGAPPPGGLKQFQSGAIFQHYTKSLARISGTDFVPATDEQLERIQDFMLSVGRSSDLTLSSIALSDTDANAGRQTFINSPCNFCHVNAGANTVIAGIVMNRNFDTGIERARIAVLNDQGIPRDGGFGLAPHDSDGDGSPDSFGDGTFNTPPLVEAADTAPFFHTNAFETIEDAIEFYTTEDFAQSPSGGGNPIALNATEIANIGKFLRVLNASFNCKIAAKRLDAVVQIAGAYQNHFKGLQAGLLDAAQAEVRDALAVLNAVGINGAQQVQLSAADAAITDALSNNSHMQRLAKASTALSNVQAASSGLGTGLTFTVGQGSLMF